MTVQTMGRRVSARVTQKDLAHYIWALNRTDDTDGYDLVKKTDKQSKRIWSLEGDGYTLVEAHTKEELVTFLQGYLMGYNKAEKVGGSRW